MNKRLHILIIALSLTFLAAFTANAQICTVNPGAPQTICQGSPFILSGTATPNASFYASGGQPVWTQISGPAVTVGVSNFNATTGAVTANVTGAGGNNVYRFRLTARCSDGSIVNGEVDYTTVAVTTANAGTNVVNACAGTINMTANAFVPGDETGVWTIVSGSLPTPSPATSPTGSVTIPSTSAGTTVFKWTITRGTCTSSSEVTVSYRGGVAVVDAHTPGVNVINFNKCYTTTRSQVLAASYGGPGSGQIGTWSLVSGPSTPSFTDINSNTATVSNLVEGTYILRWTVVGPCANGTSDLTINVEAATQSVTAVGGGTVTYCDTRTSTSLNGTVPVYTNETVLWTQSAGQISAGVVIQNPTSPTTVISGLNGTTNRSFTYTITNSVTNCTTTGTYNINYNVAPTLTVNTGSPNFYVTCGQTTAAIPYTTTGGNQTQWALVSGPSTTSYANVNSSPINLSSLQAGIYVLRVRRFSTSSSGACSETVREINVHVNRNPTVATSPSKQFIPCNTTSGFLAGNDPNALGGIGVGKWTQLSGPNTAVIADPSNPTTAISGLTNGGYVFRWTISDGSGGCQSTYADAIIGVAATSPTTSVAGFAQSVCNGTPVTLSGNTPALHESGQWSVSPSAGVNIANSTTPNPTVTGLVANTAYTFTWTITNGCGTSQSSVVITTTNLVGPQAANAGPDQCFTSPATFTLAGNQPSGVQASGTETGTWTKIDGPGSPVITNASLYNTTVTGASAGTYRFRWTLSKNGCVTQSDDVLISLGTAPATATVGAVQNLCNVTTTNLTGNVLTGIGSGLWTQMEGPNLATITDPTLNTSGVTGLIEGKYVFRWQVFRGLPNLPNSVCATSSAFLTINIGTPPTTATVGPTQSLCGTTSTFLTGNTITVGTGRWVVASGPNSPTFTNINSPTTQITGLITGQYKLQWTSTNGTICTSTSAELTINVVQIAAAGSNQTLCGASTTVLAGNEGSNGDWTMVSSTDGSNPTITKNSNNTAIITGMTTNLTTVTYTFRYTIPITLGCPLTSADMTVVVNGPPSAADAGVDKFVCFDGVNPSSIALSAANPTGGTGSWVTTVPDANRPSGVTGAPNAPTFSNANDRLATLGNLKLAAGQNYGVYIIEWQVTNGSCSSNRDITRVSIYRTPSDAEILGGSQVNVCNSNVNLRATPPAVGLGTWTQIGNTPNVAIIESPNNPSTRVTNAIPGLYTFRWTVTNGPTTACAAKIADVTFDVTSTPVSVADALAAVDPNIINLCNTSGLPTMSTTLNAVAPGVGEFGRWSIINQPIGSALTDGDFSDPTSPTATISGLRTATGTVAGTYLLRWTIKNTINAQPSDCQSVSDLTINVYTTPTPAVIPGGNMQVCLYSPVALAADPVTVGTGLWTVLSKPGTIDPIFSSTSVHNPTITGLEAGVYSFRWTVSNGSCTPSTTTMTLTVSSCQIAIAKSVETPVQQTDGSYNITMKFKVRNTGNTALTGVQVEDNLLLTFPSPKTFTKVSLVSSSPSLVINPTFNGDSDKNMLTAGSSGLAASEEVELTLIVKVTLK